ncbi:MAG: UvrD-helicase domain-containing protein [Acidimicrobiales bacterium]
MPVPGPVALGRGVVVNQGGAIPAPWITAPVVTVDDDALRSPAPVVGRLHEAWAAREPVVVELAVDPARFRTPQHLNDEPWRLSPDFEPWFDRLHFLVWANTYDARSTDDPIWWWGRKAGRLGATPTPQGAADVELADGTPAWIDGGPRRPLDPADVAGHAVVHAESVELGALVAAPPPVAPTADLAPDQLAAVGHLSGPARVIAPAGSGKTRVLTERLRHLLGDRAWERRAVSSWPTTRRPSSSWSGARRRSDHGSAPSTRSGSGCSPRPAAPCPACSRSGSAAASSSRSCPAGASGGPTPTRSAPTWRRSAPSASAWPTRPTWRSRDDVDGLAELFRPYRDHLLQRGAVDFDDQVYGAIEALLRDGHLRRRLQGRCRHLLVDEFQDLTPAHVLLIRLRWPSRRSTCSAWATTTR